ncbi:MAG: type II toxin-antitoxin system VapC family toxin [Streptosporangiaceae bacterium]
MACTQGIFRAELIRRLIDRSIGMSVTADLDADLTAIRVILVGSDVLIANLRGVQAAQDWLLTARRETGPLAISVVSMAEVAGGMRSSERRRVSRLLSSLRTFPVSERIAWRAAEFMRAHRRSHQGIGIGHYLIAATAEVKGLELATLNVRHFPMMADLQAPFRL